MRSDAGLAAPGLEFRPLRRADLPLLGEWLAEPGVARWWPMADLSAEAIAEHYGPAIDGTDPTLLLLAVDDGGPFGFCQTYRHADEPDWDRTIGLPGVAGIDYLIGGAARRGRGLGTRMIGALCELAFARYPDVAGIASVPQATNTASRKVLERNGFRLVDVRMVESDDPGDAGPGAIYLLERP